MKSPENVRGKLSSSAAKLIFALAILVGTPMPSQTTPRWTATWGSSQLQPNSNEELAKGALDGVTLRQIVHLSVGGTQLRLRLANTFGTRPLLLRTVHIALRKSGAGNDHQSVGSIDQASERTVTFHGNVAATIPLGAEFLSDPVSLPVAPLSDLVVTMLIESAPAPSTFHGGAHATSFVALGDHVSDIDFTSSQTFTRWYFLSGIEVSGTPKAAGTVVALGDSITDGHASTTDGNDRWPDVLAGRLAAGDAKHELGVVNEGIGGNCILQTCLGQNALSRFDRDVLAQPDVRYLIVLEGINDLGALDRLEEHPQAAHDQLVANLETGFEQLAARAHEHGIRIYGATLTPFLGSDYYHPSARSDGDRKKLNDWIRTSPIFDGFIDFDASLRDPAQPDHMLPAFDCGDHLHPGPAGYKRMGESISLKLFSR